MLGEGRRRPARKRYAEAARRQRCRILRSERGRRFFCIKREYNDDRREKGDRVAAMRASAARADHAFVFMSRMRWIAGGVVCPAERAGNKLRNACDVALDVAPPEWRNNEGDRLQHDQTNDRMRAKSAQRVLRVIVKLPHRLLSADHRGRVNKKPVARQKNALAIMRARPSVSTDADTTLRRINLRRPQEGMARTIGAKVCNMNGFCVLPQTLGSLPEERAKRASRRKRPPRRFANKLSATICRGFLRDIVAERMGENAYSL